MNEPQPYKPELGQIFYGHKPQRYTCKSYVVAALMAVRERLDRAMWNTHQEGYESPFSNTGNRFECDAFSVHAYDWGDDPQPWNFKWKDVEVSWYKYFGRGMSINREITPDECAAMLSDCLEALRRYEDKHDREDVGGQ